MEPPHLAAEGVSHAPPVALRPLVRAPGAKDLTDPVGATARFQITLGSAAAVTSMRVGFGAFPFGFAIIVVTCLVSTSRLLRGLAYVASVKVCNYDTQALPPVTGTHARVRARSTSRLTGARRDAPRAHGRPARSSRRRPDSSQTTIIGTATAARVLGIVVDGAAPESLVLLRPEVVLLALSLFGVV